MNVVNKRASKRLSRAFSRVSGFGELDAFEMCSSAGFASSRQLYGPLCVTTRQKNICVNISGLQSRTVSVEV